MFTYTSLFLVSLLVAIVARVIYKTTAEKNGSVYNTKLPDAELVKLATPVKRKATANDGADAAYPTDLRGRGTYAYLSGNEDVLPLGAQIAEDAPHEWTPSDHAAPADQSKQAEGHCSLFDLDSAIPADVQKPVAEWPQREDKAQLGGKAHKMTGKVAAENVSLDTEVKPWGW